MSRSAANVTALHRPRPQRASLSALIDALLENADLRHELGGGRTLLRLSASAMTKARRTAALGEDVARLADMAVIWDERDGVLVRVLDGGPQVSTSSASETGGSAEDRFELTDQALDYIAQIRSRA